MKNTDKNKDFLSVNIVMSNLSNPIFIITTLCENSSIKSSSIRKVSLFFNRPYVNWVNYSFDVATFLV